MLAVACDVHYPLILAAQYLVGQCEYIITPPMAMFTPQATPRTSGRNASQRNPNTARAPYTPPSIQSWVSQQNPEPLNAEIAAERYRRRFNARQDGCEYPGGAGQKFLHPHFLLNNEERLWAWHEGLIDMQYAVWLLSSQ